MDLCDQLCLAGQLSYLMKSLPDTTGYFQPNIYIPVMPIGTIDFLPFLPLSVWSWVWLGVTRSEKSETFWLHFQLIGDEIWCGVEAVLVNSLILLTVSENFSVGIHLDLYKWIWSKLGVMVDIIECYILIPGHLWTDLFETWYDARHELTLHNQSF